MKTKTKKWEEKFDKEFGDILDGLDDWQRDRGNIQIDNIIWYKKKLIYFIKSQKEFSYKQGQQDLAEKVLKEREGELPKRAEDMDRAIKHEEKIKKEAYKQSVKETLDKIEEIMKKYEGEPNAEIGRYGWREIRDDLNKLKKEINLWTK